MKRGETARRVKEALRAREGRMIKQVSMKVWSETLAGPSDMAFALQKAGMRGKHVERGKGKSHYIFNEPQPQEKVAPIVNRVMSKYRGLGMNAKMVPA